MDHHGIPWVPVCTNMSGYLHYQRHGDDLREPREMWHPAAAWFLSLLNIVCMCSLRLSPLSQKRNDPGSRFFLSELMLAETTLEIIWAEFCPCSTHRRRFCAEFCPCQAHRSRLFFPIYLSLPHLLFCIPPSILWFFSLSQTNNRCLKSKDLLSGCTIWMDIKYIDLDTPLFLSILSI